MKDAYADIDRLKNGQAPEYSFNLTPHVYFMMYFLDNVYSAYIAWFLIYKAGLLPTKPNILDVAAGPGTVAFGLTLCFYIVVIFPCLQCISHTTL